MACLYCNKEVPFRMRLTGEEQFCCPSHKRLYNDEHSRIGLARLLEEVTPAPAKPAVEEPPPKTEPEPVEVLPGDALDEPKAVATNRGLELWTYARIGYVPEPRFERLTRLEYTPAEYTPGAGGRPARPGTASPNPPKRQRAVPAEPRVRPAAAHAVRPEESAAASQLVQRILDVSETNKGVAPRQKRMGVEPKAETEKPGPPDAAELEQKNRKPPKSETTERVMFGSSYPEKTLKESGAQSTTKIAAGVVLALCLGAGGYLGLGIGGGGEENGAGAGAATARTLEEWIPRWSDGEQGEEIALFGPSQEWSDYKVEWDADASAGVAWVFRAADPENYYAVRLDRTESGQLRMARYAIIDGARTAASETPLRSKVTNQSTFGVRLEVNGSRFTLFVEGKSVADWTDDRLYHGGFGIIRPDMGLAGVGDVKITQLARESASQGERFWQGSLPGRLPDVTLIGRRPSPAADRNDGDTESNL